MNSPAALTQATKTTNKKCGRKNQARDRVTVATTRIKPVWNRSVVMPHLVKLRVTSAFARVERADRAQDPVAARRGDPDAQTARQAGPVTGKAAW
jgi:hypothetical protein